MDIPVINTLKERLGRVGFTGERKALSLFLLGLFSNYFLLLMLVVRTELPEWFHAFAAMFTLYVITFFGVAAGWFWGRWVAIGLGTWGATIAAWGVVSARAFEPALLVLGGTHALIALLMSGDSMAAHYEASPAWRTRLGLDDEGVKRLRRSVTRAASSIPAIVLFALAPRDGGGEALLACAVVGLGALLIGRTLALLPIAAAAVGAFVLSFQGPAMPLDTHGLFTVPASAPVLGLYAGLLLTAALAPFVRPIGRYLRG